MTDYTQLMLAQLAPQFASLNKPRDPYAARRAFGLNVMQQGASTKPVSGVVEGLARALQAGVGGYFLNRANEDQDTEEKGNAAALSAALQAKDKDGNPDIAGITAALARDPKLAPLAAQMQIFSVLQNRDQSQAGARAGAITGGALPPPPMPGPGASAPPGEGGQFNVGNILAPGRTPGPGAWRTYDTPEAAVAGVRDNLRAYPAAFNGGQPMSILQIAPRWAQGKDTLDAGSQAWARNVALTAGLDPNQPLDFSNPQVMARLAKGIHVAEFGQGKTFPDEVYLRGVTGGQGQPQGGQPPARVAGPPMAPPAPPVAIPPQAAAPQAGPIPMQFGGQPPAQPPARPPAPQMAAAPPIEGAGIDDSGAGGGPPPNPGFATGPTMPLPPQPRVDDGSQEFGTAQRLFALTNDPKAQEQALQYWKMGMEKRAKAQQFQVDLYGKEPPMTARTALGGVGVVDGAEEAKRRLAAAAAQGSAQGGGVLQPGTEPNTGAPGMVNPVTNEFKPSPAPFNEDQGKVAGYADRMRNSGTILDRLEIQGLSRRNPALERVPLDLGRGLQDPEWQQFDQAKRDFVNAQLRRESGAVISPSEFENAEKQYFPRPGDSPEVIEQKRMNRKLALEAMTRGAGPAYKPTDAPPPAAGNPALDQARDAIKRGAPRDKVIERLKSMGIDPGGL